MPVFINVVEPTRYCGKGGSSTAVISLVTSPGKVGRCRISGQFSGRSISKSPVSSNEKCIAYLTISRSSIIYNYFIGMRYIGDLPNE